MVNIEILVKNCQWPVSELSGNLGILEYILDSGARATRMTQQKNKQREWPTDWSHESNPRGWPTRLANENGLKNDLGDHYCIITIFFSFICSLRLFWRFFLIQANKVSAVSIHSIVDLSFLCNCLPSPLLFLKPQ